MNKDQLYKELKNYEPEMTMTERSKAYFNGERVDHLPYSVMSFDRLYGINKGYNMRQLADIDLQIKLIEERSKIYGNDTLDEELNLRDMGHALGTRLIFPNNDIDYVEKFVMEDELNMDLIKMVDPYTNEVLSQHLNRARILKDKFPNHTISSQIAGPLSTAAAIRPIEKLLRDIRKSPDTVKELLEFCIEANLRWAEAFANEFGGVSYFISEPVACDDILSPKQVKEFSDPYLRKLTSKLYEINGIKSDLHICGHTKKQWETYKSLDISVYSVDNCEDLKECKEVIEDDLVLMGNVPPVEVMRYGSIDDVIKSVRECIIKGADSKSGYICSTGCGTPIGTPQENIDAFTYAVWKYSADAKLGEIPKAVWEN